MRALNLAIVLSHISSIYRHFQEFACTLRQAVAGGCATQNSRMKDTVNLSAYVTNILIQNMQIPRIRTLHSKYMQQTEST